MSTQHVVHKIYEPGLPGDGFTAPEAEQARAAINRIDPGTAGDIGQVVVQSPTGPQWAPPQARISAHALGVRADTGTDQTAALHAAFAAAEALGGGRSIELPAGRIRIDGTFSLAGYSSGLVGTTGSTIVGSYGPGNGTVLYAVNQTGPVLDFNGYLPPRAQKGRVFFGDFNVEGDGTVGAAKMGISLYTGTNASSIDMQRITISNTGGIPFYVKDFYLSDFYGITAMTPIDCYEQDTPYMRLEGANGNRYFGLGIRSSNHDAGVADTPVSGALRLVSGSTYQHHQSVFYGLWFENNHLGNNSALIVSQTNNVVYSDTEFFDCYRVSGATNTAHARIQSPATQNYGANVWRGFVPGKGSSGLTEIELGIDVSQNGTLITGPKGNGGNNIRLNAGVSYCHVELTGAYVAGNNLGIVDNSGNTTNTTIDGPMGIWNLGGRAGTEVLKIGGLAQTNRLNNMGNVSGNIGLNLNPGVNIFRMILTGATTITAITYADGIAGREVTVIAQQDATGSRTLSWGTSIRFAGGVPPAASTGANRVDMFTFMFDGTNWRETSRSMNTN